MAENLPSDSAPVFEQIKRLDENGSEFWSSRDLAKVFGYSEYRNFQPAIERAKEACENSDQPVEDHFVDIHEMVKIGSGAQRKMPSISLSRYACYLIVQNADPAKEVVALGQTYFAVQTRLREIQQMEAYGQLPSEDDKRLFLRNELRRHNSQLAEAAKNAGVVDAIDYAIFAPPRPRRNSAGKTSRANPTPTRPILRSAKKCAKPSGSSAGPCPKTSRPRAASYNWNVKKRKK